MDLNDSAALDAFYSHLLDCMGTYGLFTLKEADGRHPWPEQGVYFFFDPNEPIPKPGLPGRVVRIGTHGVAKNTNSTLWSRLHMHQGSKRNGGGNHRGSIFRWHIGKAINGTPSSWDWDDARKGIKANSEERREVRRWEHEHERLVSDYIHQLPFTVIAMPGSPGKDCQRAVFETECIAYLSWCGQNGLIKIGSDWLGLRATNDKIKTSGLWNVNDVWMPGNHLPYIPTWPPFPPAPVLDKPLEK
jgi:hypothetical protein